MDTTTLARLRQLGATFRARRKALGVTAVAAADAAGVSRITWYRMEKGEPTVTLGAWANAAHVLGLDWPGLPADGQGTGIPAAGRWLPLDIALDEYPQLRRVAWSVTGRATLAPREAWAFYQRHAADLDPAAMPPRERALHEALREAFAAGDV